MRLFRKDFQRNVQLSIQMPDIIKRNPNVRFIFSEIVHGYEKHGLTVILVFCTNSIVKKLNHHFHVSIVAKYNFYVFIMTLKIGDNALQGYN